MIVRDEKDVYVYSVEDFSNDGFITRKNKDKRTTTRMINLLLKV